MSAPSSTNLLDSSKIHEWKREEVEGYALAWAANAKRLVGDFRHLKDEHNRLKDEHSRLKDEHNSLKDRNDLLEEKHKDLQKELLETSTKLNISRLQQPNALPTVPQDEQIDLKPLLQLTLERFLAETGTLRLFVKSALTMLHQLIEKHKLSKREDFRAMTTMQSIVDTVLEQAKPHVKLPLPTGRKFQLLSEPCKWEPLMKMQSSVVHQKEEWGKLFEQAFRDLTNEASKEVSSLLKSAIRKSLANEFESMDISEENSASHVGPAQSEPGASASEANRQDMEDDTVESGLDGYHETN